MIQENIYTEETSSDYEDQNLDPLMDHVDDEDDDDDEDEDEEDEEDDTDYVTLTSNGPGLSGDDGEQVIDSGEIEDDDADEGDEDDKEDEEEPRDI